MIYTNYGISVSTHDLKGELSKFPIEIVCRMLYEAQRQGNSADKALLDFQLCHIRAACVGGFDWCKAESHNNKIVSIFWSDILLKKNFDLFYTIYSNNRGFYTPETDDQQIYLWYTPEMTADDVTKICRKEGRLKKEVSLNSLKGIRNIESKIILSSENISINNKNEQNYEIRLQKPKAVVREGIVPKGNCICGKKGKSSITVESLSYTRVIGG